VILLVDCLRARQQNDLCRDVGLCSPIPIVTEGRIRRTIGTERKNPIDDHQPTADHTKLGTAHCGTGLRLASAKKAVIYRLCSSSGAKAALISGDYIRAKARTLPLFTGFRIDAQAEEARLRQIAAERQAKELSDTIARDLRIAILNAPPGIGL